MARQKGTIPLSMSIEPNIGAPLDAREKVTLKSDLILSSSFPYPWVGMKVYCAEDKITYQLINEDFTKIENWSPDPTSQDIKDVNQQFSAYNAYTNEINKLRTELEALKNYIKSDKIQKSIKDVHFESSIFEHDFLPDHERSNFCTDVIFEYDGEYIEEGEDTIFVNGKTITLSHHEIGLKTTILHIVSEYGVVNIYENDILIDTLPNDTFILTLNVYPTNLDSLSDNPINNFEFSYSYLEYRNIRIYSKNDFPITENYAGKIQYWTRRPQYGGNYATSIPWSFSAQHSKAIYTCGNNWEADLYYMFNVAWEGSSSYAEGSFQVPREHVIEYMYTSQWDFSKVTCLQQIAVFSGTTAINHDYQQNREYVDNYLKRVEWEDIKWPTVTQKPHKTGGEYFLGPFNTYATKTYGNLSQLGSVVQYIPKYSRLSFSGNFSIESYGDLSNWDVSKFIRFDELFAQNFNLNFIGDIGRWKLGSGNDLEFDKSKPTVIKNIFRFCFKLKGISSAIGDWDVSKCIQLNGIFQGAMCIGDDTLVNLWKWNTHNCTNFGEIFSYLTPTISHGWKARYSPSYTKDWDTICTEYQDANTSEERKEELEWQLIKLNMSAIEAKRTNLSFVEKWDMSSSTQLRDMFAYNPYLIDVGDLRLWHFDVTDGSEWTELGASGMFAYCTALENLKMPSIPRGVNVDKIVKGCISLANIEIDELNVEFISFQDCPLTKQSILNLINAATDDVTIKLNSEVYTNYNSDSDILSAISNKNNSGIEVILTN